MSAVLPTPVVMTVYYNITYFCYEVTRVDLFKSADLYVSLMDDNNTLQKRVFYKLEGTEYSGWGGDDQYIINLIIEKIPGWINPPPTPPTPPTPTPTPSPTDSIGTNV